MWSAAGHGDRVAGPQRAEPEEDPRPVLGGVHVAEEHRRARARPGSGSPRYQPARESLASGGTSTRAVRVQAELQQVRATRRSPGSSRWTGSAAGSGATAGAGAAAPSGVPDAERAALRGPAPSTAGGCGPPPRPAAAARAAGRSDPTTSATAPARTSSAATTTGDPPAPARPCCSSWTSADQFVDQLLGGGAATHRQPTRDGTGCEQRRPPAEQALVLHPGGAATTGVGRTRCGMLDICEAVSVPHSAGDVAASGRDGTRSLFSACAVGSGWPGPGRARR